MDHYPQPIAASKPEKLWTADFLKIGLIAGVFSLAFQMFGTVFPLYLKSLGASATLIGTASAGFTVAAFSIRPIAGHLADKKGRLSVLIIGLVLCVLSSIFVSIIPTIGLVILFRILQGPGMATVSTVNGTIVSDIVPRKRLAEGLGYYGVFFTIASAFGPAIALSITKNENYTPVFILNILLMFVTLLMSFTMTYEKKRKKAAEEALALNVNAADSAISAESVPEPPVEYKGIWKFVEKSALVPAMILTLLSIASAVSMTFLVPYASDRGFENIALFFAVQAGASLFIRLVGGRISTRFGSLAALIPGLILIGIAFFLIAPMNNLPMLLTAAVLYGAGFALCFPVLNALAITSAPPSRRGIANSTYACAFDIGMGVGAFIWGLVIDMSGYYPAFIAAGFVSLLCILLSVALLGKKRTPKVN